MNAERVVFMRRTARSTFTTRSSSSVICIVFIVIHIVIHMGIHTQTKLCHGPFGPGLSQGVESRFAPAASVSRRVGVKRAEQLAQIA